MWVASRDLTLRYKIYSMYIKICWIVFFVLLLLFFVIIIRIIIVFLHYYYYYYTRERPG